MRTDLFEDQVRTLFYKYYIGLVEFAFHLLKCRETAMDIVQDSFVKILNKDINVPTDLNSAKAYLYQTVRNACLNHIRHKKVVDNYFQKQGQDDHSEEVILNGLIYAETVNNLYTAIQALPKACQEICKLAYLEGKSNQEVADICGLSINTIKTQKRRSIELLRMKLISTHSTLKSLFFLFF